MIIIIVGGVGSGKTLMAVREIIRRKRPCFTNFSLYGVGHVRLKWEFIMKDKKVNWDFWKQMQKHRFDLYIDELHNLMPSRRAMSTQNVLINNWLSQIRKILGSSKYDHFYVITQRPNSIDVHFRELAHQWWFMSSQELRDTVRTPVLKDGRLEVRELPVTLITRKVYLSQQHMVYDVHGVSYPPFVANEFYRFYDSFSIVGELEEYV